MLSELNVQIQLEPKDWDYSDEDSNMGAVIKWHETMNSIKEQCTLNNVRIDVEKPVEVKLFALNPDSKNHYPWLDINDIFSVESDWAFNNKRHDALLRCTSLCMTMSWRPLAPIDYDPYPELLRRRKHELCIIDITVKVKAND